MNLVSCTHLVKFAAKFLNGFFVKHRSTDSRSRSVSPFSESSHSRSPSVEDLKSPSLVQPWTLRRESRSRSVSISPEPNTSPRSRSHSKSSNDSDRGRRSRSAGSCVDQKNAEIPGGGDGSKETKVISFPHAVWRGLIFLS